MTLVLARIKNDTLAGDQYPGFIGRWFQVREMLEDFIELEDLPGYWIDKEDLEIM